MAVTVENLKLYLGIPATDTVQDGLLAQILADASALVIGYIKEPAVDPSLEWVVREMAITRYNRIGSEGMKSISEEGKSETYAEDLYGFSAYSPFLNGYMETRGLLSGRGRARFL